MAAVPKRPSQNVQAAARHPNRPGKECKAEPGSWEPVINRGRCEGKAECVAVCPYDVFEVSRVTDEDYKALPFVARVRLRVHGMKTAYTPNVDQCRACGLCVVACPEDAITLRPRN